MLLRPSLYSASSIITLLRRTHPYIERKAYLNLTIRTRNRRLREDCTDICSKLLQNSIYLKQNETKRTRIIWQAGSLETKSTKLPYAAGFSSRIRKFIAADIYGNHIFSNILCKQNRIQRINHRFG